MATAPQYAATAKAGGILTNASADTSLTAPTNTVTLYTAGSSGSKIEQIRFKQLLTTTTSGTLHIFLYDGSTYHLFDSVAYGAATVSTTTIPEAITFFYTNLVIQSGWSIRVTNTVAAGSGTTAATHKVTCFAGDF